MRISDEAWFEFLGPEIARRHFLGLDALTLFNLPSGFTVDRVESRTEFDQQFLCVFVVGPNGHRGVIRFDKSALENPKRIQEAVDRVIKELA